MPEQSGDTVGASHTLLEIVDALQELDSGTVREIADHVDTSKSTVHRHLQTLLQHEFVVREVDGTYHLGLRFLDVGGFVRSRNPKWDLVREKVKICAAQTGELSQFIVEEHGLGVFVFRERGEQAVKTEARVGSRTYLNHSSAGKALFAHLPRERQNEILDRRGLPEKTPQTITSRERFLEECESIVSRGYAVDRNEHISGLWSVGTPITNEAEEVIGAISVAGPEHRMREEYVTDEIPNLLLGLSNEINLNLTYS